MKDLEHLNVILELLHARLNEDLDLFGDACIDVIKTCATVRLILISLLCVADVIADVLIVSAAPRVQGQ